MKKIIIFAMLINTVYTNTIFPNQNKPLLRCNPILTDCIDETSKQRAFDPMDKKLTITKEEIANEQWFLCPGHEKTHLVSTLGRIKGLPRISTGKKGNERQLSENFYRLNTNVDGYNIVSLDGKQESMHQLVAWACVPNDDWETKIYVHHKNRIRNDNRRENLEWVTEAENLLYSYRLGARDKKMDETCPELNDILNSIINPQPIDANIFNKYVTYTQEDFKREEWRPVVGHEDTHLISNIGRLKSLSRYVEGRWGSHYCRGKLRNIQCSGRYLTTIIDGRNYLIHRLVALAFIENPKNKKEVNHKDGNRLNNNVENLEWATRRENALHAYRFGLQKPYGCPKKNGKDSPFSKAVIQLTMDGVPIKKWDSMAGIRRETGMCAGSVSMACSGKAKQAYGYKWQYA